MDISAKKIITNLFYYTLALLVLLFSVLFMVSLGTKTLANYQSVVYYIWTALLIVVLIADVIATIMGRYKLFTGLCVYGLMICALIVGFIVFAGMSVGGVIPFASLDVFNTLIYYSLALTIGLIFVYKLGLKSIRLSEIEE